MKGYMRLKIMSQRTLRINPLLDCPCQTRAGASSILMIRMKGPNVSHLGLQQ